MLVIEVDGDSHTGQEEYDQARSDWLQAQRYRVIRFTNQEINTDKEVVLASILDACRTDIEI